MRWQTQDDEYPKVDTPCLVIFHSTPTILVWNANFEAWDDEDGDDYFCDKEDIEKWYPLNKITTMLEGSE